LNTSESVIGGRVLRFDFRNYVTLRISQIGCEKFFNLCLQKNICFINIHNDEFGVVCTVAAADFKRIRGCVRKSGVRISVIRKKGLGICLKKHRKRYGFFVGAFIAFLCFAYLTSCIWVIDIRGNEETEKEEILSALKNQGIYIGSLRFGHDVKNIQNEILIKLDSLSWLWISLDGTRAVVDIREKGNSNEEVDYTTACNLVALYDGYITDIIAKSGRRVVENGDVVKKGDLLVSGISSTNFHGNRYIHADGTVMAKTWRTKSGEYHHTQTNFTRSGKKVKKRSVNFFGFDVNLYIEKEPAFELYEVETQKRQIKIFDNIYLPLTFTTDTFYEIIKSNVEISDSEVVSAAVDRLTYEIEKERAEGAVTAKREYAYKKLENGNVFVSVTVESSENIAVPVRIDIEKTEEDQFGKDT